MDKAERTTLKEHHARLSSPLFQSSSPRHQRNQSQSQNTNLLPVDQKREEKMLQSIDVQARKRNFLRSNTLANDSTDTLTRQQILGNKIIEKLWNIQQHPQFLQMNYFKRLMDLNAALAESQAHWHQAYNSKFQSGLQRKSILKVQKLPIQAKTIQTMKRLSTDSKMLSSQLKKQLQILHEGNVNAQQMSKSVNLNSKRSSSLRIQKSDFKVQLNKYNVKKIYELNQDSFLNKKILSKEVNRSDRQGSITKRSNKETIRKALNKSKRSNRSRSIENSSCVPFHAEIQHKALPSKFPKPQNESDPPKKKSKSVKIEDRSIKAHQNVVHRLRLFKKYDQEIRAKEKALKIKVDLNDLFKQQNKPRSISFKQENKFIKKIVSKNEGAEARRATIDSHSLKKNLTHSPNTPIQSDDRWMFDFQKRVKEQKLKQERRLQKIAAKAQGQILKYQFFEKPKSYHVNLSLKLKQKIKSDLQLSRSLQKMKAAQQKKRIYHPQATSPSFKYKMKESKKIQAPLKKEEKKKLVIQADRKQAKTANSIKLSIQNKEAKQMQEKHSQKHDMFPQITKPTEQDAHK